MKNIVRAIAVSLVVTGAFASAHLSHAAQGTVVTAKVSSMPPPMCPWNDPNGCGIGDFGN